METTQDNQFVYIVSVDWDYEFDNGVNELVTVFTNEEDAFKYTKFLCKQEFERFLDYVSGGTDIPITDLRKEVTIDQGLSGHCLTYDDGDCEYSYSAYYSKRILRTHYVEIPEGKMKNERTYNS